MILLFTDMLLRGLELADNCILEVFINLYYLTGLKVVKVS